MEVTHAVGIHAAATPLGAGNVALGLDVAVAGGVADKLIPGAHADQGAIGLLEQRLGLAQGGVVLGMGRNGHAKLLHRLKLVRQARFGAQVLHEPGIQAAIQQAYVFHPGIHHQMGGAGRRHGVATIEDDGGVVADAVLQQQLLEGFVRDLVPQRLRLQAVGVDVTSPRNVAQQIGLGSPPVHFEHLPLPLGGGSHRLACLQIGEPERIDQLLPAGQVLARRALPALQLEQLLDALLAQQAGHLGHFPRCAVEGDREIGLQPLARERLWPLFIAVFPLGGEVLGTGHMATLRLARHGPALVEVAGAGIQNHGLLRLGIGQGEGGQFGGQGGPGTPEQQGGQAASPQSCHSFHDVVSMHSEQS